MPTFNSGRSLEACLASIDQQDYQGKVELIVADGGSTDQTLSILKEYGCQIIHEELGNPEQAKALALKHATGELILFLASDNVLPDQDWLSTMVESLAKEPTAVAAYPWRYEVRSSDTSLNRYFAIFGANDPLARFMGKADRQAWGSKAWQLSGDAKDKNDYWLVRFNPDNMPTLGDNGVLVWKEKLLKAKVSPKHFSHIDVFWDLVDLGLDQYIVVKNTIVHDTGSSFIQFLGKRYQYLTKLYLEQKEMRRFTWLETTADKLKLVAYCFYAMTLVGPLIESVIKFTSYPDWACFWHPLMASATCWVYGVAVFKNSLS